MGKEPICNAGDTGSIPGLGRSPEEGHGNPLQYSCPKNPMDKEVWLATAQGIAKSRTQLSNYTLTIQTNKLDLEKAEETETKLPTSTVSQKKQENSRKVSTSASLTTPKPLTVRITTNWKILQEMGITDHLICLL